VHIYIYHLPGVQSGQVYKKRLTETGGREKPDQKKYISYLPCYFLKGVNNFVAILRVEKDQEGKKQKEDFERTKVFLFSLSDI
jgi:hypothetical protein